MNNIVRELRRATAEIQLRTICTIMDLPYSRNTDAPSLEAWQDGIRLAESARCDLVDNLLHGEGSNRG